MKGCLYVVRGNELKLQLPGQRIVVKGDGTLWYGGRPILGIEDPDEKTRCIALVNAERFGEIAAEYFVRMGDNPNGVWAGDDSAWEKHPAKIAQDKIAAEKEAARARMVSIHLSTRGWGDYSSCEWFGDITRPDREILAECKRLLSAEHDVDRRNQSDDEILARVTDARKLWRTASERKDAREKAESEDIRRKIETGYCFSCESWCHGDCGHYSNDPKTRLHRDLKQAQREARSGIND